MLTFLRDNARWVGGGFLLTLLSSFGQTFFIALSAGELRETFDLTHGAFARLYMAATLASALTLPLLGRIVDVVRVSRTVFLSVSLLALGCVAVSTAPNLPVLVGGLYMLRLFGQGMMTHIAMTAMGRWYRRERGRAVSFAAIGHQAGEALLPLLFVMAMGSGLGWRDVWLLAAAALVIAGLPAGVALLSRERTPRDATSSTVDGEGGWTRGEVLRDPLFWVTMTGVLAPAFIGTSIFFHQVHLIELRGWDPLAFATGFTLLGAVTVAATLAAGRLVDRVGAIRLLPLFPVPLAAGCLALGSVGDQSAIYLFFGLMGLSYGFSQTLFGALWPEMYGTRHLGGVRSVVVSLMVLATALGPAITGTLIDRGVAFPTQVLGMAAYTLAIVAVLLPVSRVAMRRAVAAGGGLA